MQPVKFKRSGVLILAQTDLSRRSQNDNKLIEFVRREMEKHELKYELILFKFENDTFVTHANINYTDYSDGGKLFRKPK